MKKIFVLLLALAFTSTLGWLLKDTWDTTRYVLENGKSSTVKIAAKYNTAVWDSPLPIKKLQTYTATLAEKYEVLLVTDQELLDKQTISIRFVMRDQAAAVQAQAFRPVANAIRLRVSDDGTPVKIPDTDIFDRAVDRAMGPLGPGVSSPSRPVAESAPDRAKPTVPFLIAGPDDGMIKTIWANTTIGEWLLIGFFLYFLQSFWIHAWNTPWTGRSRSDGKNFVHSSLRRIDPDKAETPSAKVAYQPRRKGEDVALTDSEKRAEAVRKTVAYQPTSETPPEPAPDPADVPPPLTHRETAPPMPIATPDVSLKLSRKPKPENKPAPPAE